MLLTNKNSIVFNCCNCSFQSNYESAEQRARDLAVELDKERHQLSVSNREIEAMKNSLLNDKKTISTLEARIREIEEDKNRYTIYLFFCRG